MTLSWFQIVRLGLVQMCLGSIVVLTTSTLNRLMVVELSLAAVVPGMLVALHYGIQLSRPTWGFASDAGGQRTRWIVGGMVALALGALIATGAILIFPHSFSLGLAASLGAYALIGLGVGASGTSLLALIATTTAPQRRAGAATVTWLMMIFGIAVTAGTVGTLLNPYTPALLLKVVFTVTCAAVLLTILAVWGIEGRLTARAEPDATPFREGLREVWSERRARNFTLFVFLSMTAYFMQELILEPYAGLVFDFTPGQSTQLSGAQNGGTFLGMLCVGILATGFKVGGLRGWVIAGCIGSALSLAALALIGPMGPGAPLVPVTVALGFFNGVFAVAAIGSMMALAGQGRERREGTRMGLWGAAQAVAAGFGGLTGAALVDVLRLTTQDTAAFGSVFLFEAALFLAAAAMAARIMDRKPVVPANLVPGE
ncbi:MFS transporter, BCD family, chlorophyll transporter [Loktanella atrilutea]|uniref:MFS transporter, BCD family, chlorophyll transporter n=1 Tax=Loktanella atrilutea TaxID=366533 RepID=A0A1M4Z3A4_LOKAT|nr:BCD family MFS transporter [Loktanella atrilutea]SHF12543.1 MFS transporter, BCD family, chlorophyll transporter [Loktanella atrilutea]